MLRYIETFGYTKEEYGEDEFNIVTFESCIAYLLELDSEALKMSEQEF